jgi:selenocysteine-specific elongation factor
VVVKGDLFVLRSANETIGGGEVVEVGARRHRRQDPRVLGRLGVLARGSQEALIAQALAPHEPQELSAFLRTAPLPAAEARAALVAAVASGSVRVLGGRPLEAGATLITATGWTRLQEQAQTALKRYHATAPLRWGMSREELRSRLGLPSRVWPDVLAELIAAGVVAERGASVHLPDFTPRLDPQREAVAAAYLAALEQEPFAPSVPPPEDPELLAYLVESGAVVRVAEGVYFAASAYRQMVERVVARLQERGTITVAEVRDLFQTSRKFALGLLEYLDEQRITRRLGDGRVLRRSSEASA